MKCSYGRSYIGQTGRTIEIQIKEHARDMENQRVEKSVVTKYVKYSKHEIQFDKVKIMNEEVHFSKRTYKESIEIGKSPGNYNKEDRWKICKTGY